MKRLKFNKKFLAQNLKKRQGVPLDFFSIFWPNIFWRICMFWWINLIEGHQKRLEPMSVAQFVDFKRIRRRGNSRSRGWRGRNNFYALLREGRARMSDHIWSSSHKYDISTNISLEYIFKIATKLIRVTHWQPLVCELTPVCNIKGSSPTTLGVKTIRTRYCTADNET